MITYAKIYGELEIHKKIQLIVQVLSPQLPVKWSW